MDRATAIKLLRQEAKAAKLTKNQIKAIDIDLFLTLVEENDITGENLIEEIFAFVDLYNTDEYR